MKSFKQFRTNIQERFEREVQEDFRHDQVFCEGDWVKNTTNNKVGKVIRRGPNYIICLLYTSDADDDMQCVDLGGRRII